MEKSVTFLELIENKKILIPQIQRDYAQGRLGEKTSEVRYNFLHALKDALGKDNHKPLILDFIYGTEEDNCFKPLDGQQRLTTLFLLHWFLCPKDELFILQKNEDNNDIYSRFTYETRVSSKDFFNEIAKISYFDLKRKLDDRKTKLNEKILDKKITLSDIIIDDPWFLWEWKKDPTIKGALIVLNDLEFMFEDHLSEERLNFWKRLNSGNISFNLLHLEEFDLSDELYVKMNARGKELSQFDFFKSSLEEQMIKNEVNEDIKNEWKKNIDSTWIDLFWNKSISQEEIEHDEFDKQNENVVNTEIYYFTFLKKLIILYLLENESYFNGLDWDENALKSKLPFDYEKDTAISKIKEFAVKNNLSELFPFLYKTDFFDDSFFNFIIDTFKSLIYKENTLRNDASQLIKGVYFENDKDTLL